jgi:hypothetical protein
MGNHLQAKAHIAKVNKLTELAVYQSTSSTDDETALPIPKRCGSRAIKIASSQWKLLLHIPLNPYWSKWQAIGSKLAAEDFETSKISPWHVESLPHGRICYSTYSLECSIKPRATTVM